MNSGVPSHPRERLLYLTPGWLFTIQDLTLSADPIPSKRKPRQSEQLARASVPVTPLAIVSCILGVLSLLSLVIWPVSAITGLAASLCGSIALTQIYYSNRLKGVWLATIGVCSPAIAMITLFVLVSL